jgi:hypothetical protein
MLYYIKTNLKHGQIKTDNRGMSHFMIRDSKTIETILIPIFDKYHLKTKKKNSYKIFKSSYAI